MSAVAQAAVLVVRGYQWVISPLLPPACRFVPTCSEYAAEAFTTHGAWRGAWFSVLRLGRCHPFSRGGFDPPPSRRCDD